MVERKKWSSSILFIMACVGSAVGLGNIWKFPYITYENGGGTFVLVYLLAVLIIGMPILLAEMLIGRNSERNAYDAIVKLSNQNRWWKLVGALCLFTGFGILSFYSVVAGWTVDYFINALLGNLSHLDFTTTGQHFGSFVSNPGKQILYHTIFMAMTSLIVWRGTKGIEKAIEVLMPVLGVLIVVVMSVTVSKYGAGDTLNFLFDIDLSKITAHAILEAMGHAFFTLSVGMGTMIVYGSYFPKKNSLLKATLWIGVLDTIFALMACLMIYPIIFGTKMEVRESASILFTTLSVELQHLPFGNYICAVFYLLIAFAALSSTISLLEPVTAFFIENRNMSRAKATLVSGGSIWFLGVFCALSNGGSEFISKLKIMDHLDYITSNWTLPLGGILLAIFCAYVISNDEKARELNVSKDSMLFKSWNFLLKIVAPTLVLIVMIYRIFNS